MRALIRASKALGRWAVTPWVERFATCQEAGTPPWGSGALSSKARRGRFPSRGGGKQGVDFTQQLRIGLTPRDLCGFSASR